MNRSHTGQENNRRKRMLGIVLPVLILIAGAAITLVLIRTGPEPRKQVRRKRSVGVEVQTIHRTNIQVVVEGMGTLIPARSIRLIPEVTGKITWTNPDLEPGGVLEKESIAVEIDDRDYRDALAESEAALADARLALELEKSRSSVAREEWDLLGKDVTEPGTNAMALIYRRPQLAAAEQRVKAAERGVMRAMRRLEKTKLQVPFRAVIRNESADIGQLVTPQTSVASIVDAEEYWLKLSVPVGDLRWFKLPGRDGTEGATVKIAYTLGDESVVRRNGSVIRLLPDLDAAGHMARVLVAVPNPHGKTDQLPLLLDAYVKGSIMGRSLSEVFVIPERYMHEGNTVRVMTPENRLDIRPVNVVRYQSGNVVIDQGLKENEKIVVSRIPTPIQGMKLTSVPARQEPRSPGQ